MTKVQTDSKQELNITDWETLAEEQRETLKAALLKSNYGFGGEHFTTFPTLLDKKDNPELETEFQTSKLPRRVSPTMAKAWGERGQLKIIPVRKGNQNQQAKTYFILVLVPFKQITIPSYNLAKEDPENKLKYTTLERLENIRVTKNQYHTIGIYTNKNKAFNQAKVLSKLWEVDGDFQRMEREKEELSNIYQYNITEKGRQVLQEILPNSEAVKATGDGLTYYMGGREPRMVDPMEWIKEL